MEIKSNSAHEEGDVAKTIEEQTAKLPSDVFLWSAIGIMATSLAMQIAKQKNASLFIGQWVAPLLLFGVYNKLVKQQGHDSIDKGARVKRRTKSAVGSSFSEMS